MSIETTTCRLVCAIAMTGMWSCGPVSRMISPSRPPPPSRQFLETYGPISSAKSDQENRTRAANVVNVYFYSLWVGSGAVYVDMRVVSDVPEILAFTEYYLPCVTRSVHLKDRNDFFVHCDNVPNFALVVPDMNMYDYSFGCYRQPVVPPIRVSTHESRVILVFKNQIAVRSPAANCLISISDISMRAIADSLRSEYMRRGSDGLPGFVSKNVAPSPDSVEFVVLNDRWHH